MMDKNFLCHFDELANPGSKGFAGNSPAEAGFFLVRKNDRVFAYINSCPHTGAPLEWQADQFLDFSGKMLECSLHGAMFEIETGKCLRGPCLGESLQRQPLKIKDGRIYLSE